MIGRQLCAAKLAVIPIAPIITHRPPDFNNFGDTIPNSCCCNRPAVLYRLSGIVRKKKKTGTAWHKLVIGVISVIGAIAYGSVLVSMMDQSLLLIPHVETALIGFVSGAIFWIVLRHKLGFFGVFEHEFTHLIMGLIMFQKPEAFFATAKRGHVRVGGKNFLVDLAPYYFPTFSIILLLVFPFLRESAYAVYFPVLGFITGYHLVSQIIDFRFYQGDIRVSGMAFSVVFCLFASILTFGFVFAFVVGGYGGGYMFLRSGFPEAGRLLYLGYMYFRDFLEFATERRAEVPVE